jgi:hypothetical protein
VNALEVRISGDRLSVHADRVPLQDILQRLADLGIGIRIDPELNPKISASFDNRDLRQGLGSILKPFGHVLIWKPIEGPAGPMPKLAEIQVFRQGKKGLMKPLGKRGNLSIARNPKDGSFYVKNEILLGLKPGISLAEFKRLLRQFGGTIVDGHAGVGIYRIRIPENADLLALLEQISEHPRVAKAEPNYAYPIPKPNKDPDLAGSASAFSTLPVSPGTPPVAVLDSGLGTDSGLDDLVLASLDAIDPDEPISDSLGHGTQMAMIASGAVKPHGVQTEGETQIPVIPIRAFDDNGFTSNSSIMSSIDFALQNGARVMSLSWGSETRSDFMEAALNYARSKGLIVVAAAGNEPTGKLVYPAAYPGVIGVGALAPDGKAWKESNYGDFVTLSAPGFATLPVGYKDDPGAYAGTSISTAYVANLIANHLSKNPDATMDEILNALSGQ